ncbi:MAG: adenylate/guanylate cyclase domain-containing protein [Bacteroidales bacterium]
MKKSTHRSPRYIFFRIYLISGLIYFLLLLPFLLTQYIQNLEKFEEVERFFETRDSVSTKMGPKIADASGSNTITAKQQTSLKTDPFSLQTKALMLALLLGFLFNYPFKRYLKLRLKRRPLPPSLARFCRKYLLLTPIINAGIVFFLLMLVHAWLIFDLDRSTAYTAFEKIFYSRFFYISAVASVLISTFIYFWQKHRVHLRYLEHFFSAEELRRRIFKSRRGTLGFRLWMAGGMTTLLPLVIVLIYLFQSITYFKELPLDLHALSEEQKILLLGSKLIVHNISPEDTLLASMFYINAVNSWFMFVGIYSGIVVALIYIFFFVKWTTEDITRPVNELLQKMEQTGRDAQAHYALVKTNDEIGALTEGYNDMSLKINTFISNVQRLNEAYYRFVPRQFLDLLGRKDITDVSLGDQVAREMSVMFTDIRDFTTLSEHMTLQENFDFVNNYLGLMEPIIRSHQGFIDKYMGDAIMALFDGDVENALDAAVEMSLTLEEYNQVREAEGKPPVRMGIGIHTGMLMLGIVGGYGKMEGTVISDAVNLASRLEGLNKVYGARLIISEATYAKLSHPEEYLPRHLDRVMVKGKSKAVEIYELLAAEPEPFRSLKLSYRPEFEKGVNLYRRKQFEIALALFEKILNLHPDDLAVCLYVSRCRERIIAGDSPFWDGSERISEK